MTTFGCSKGALLIPYKTTDSLDCGSVLEWLQIILKMYSPSSQVRVYLQMPSISSPHALHLDTSIFKAPFFTPINNPSPFPAALTSLTRF